MSAPLRILHVLDHSLPEASGYSLRTHGILLAQRRLGWSTFQLTGPKQGSVSTASESVDGVDYMRTVAKAPPRLIARAPFDFFWGIQQFRARLHDVIAEVRPDLLHVHSPCSNGLAALGHGPPVVYEMRTLWEDGSILAGRLTEGSMSHRLARSLETFVLRRAAAVVTISEGLRAEVVARRVPAEKITVVPNAVDVENLTRQRKSSGDSRIPFGLSGRCVLGYVGSLFAWEGLDLLLRAFSSARQRRPDLGLLIVGSGPESDRLKAAANRLGLAEHVVFTGKVSPAAAIDAYDAIDMLVYPRLPMRLTEAVTPLKPLEAMALGKAVIASDVGGHRELIRDRETGVLFRAGDENALAATVVELAGNAALRASLVANGARFVRNQRGWSDVVRNYEAAYRSVVEG